ncbi:MAG TPA: glycosyltransferase, partial [Phycisphaerae bacterium]
MTVETVTVEACRLNLGELHRLDDFGFFHPSFTCVTTDGSRFVASMRLHVTEPLNPLVIADPRAFSDGGSAANSAGSAVLPRRAGYEDTGPPGMSLPRDVRLFEIRADQIAEALWRPFAATAPKTPRGPIHRLAVTCHNPQQVGGGNTVLFRYINWLAALGVHTTVYSCGSPPTWTRVEASFRRFDTYDELFAAVGEEALILFSMWHIEPLLRAPRRPRHVVHLRQSAEPFQYGVDWQSMRARKPVIDLLESLPLDVITVSPHLQQRYLAETGLHSHLITNGIDLSTFHPDASALRTPSEPRLVLSVGDPRHFLKGASVLAEALETLAARRTDRSFRWIIAGADPDYALPFAVTKSRNVEVIYRGRVTTGDMPQLYSAAHVFVNSSLYEGFGLPTLEAMACGAPVVHADNGGLDGLIRDGRDCLVVPPNDSRAMADAIERILEEPGLAERLAAAALDTVSKHSLLAQFDAFAAAFNDLLEGALDATAVAALRESIRHEQAGVPQPAPFDKPASRRRPPLVSVVIPTYNQADYLGAALDSVLAQTYEHWEAVVVNDGSTDGTAAVLARYAAIDPRIRPFTTPNRGITATLNEGLRHARGEYFCWLSSDDLYYPDKLRIQVEAFDALGPDWSLVYGSFDFLQEETGQIDNAPMLPPIVPGAEFAEALKFDFIDGCTVMIRMSALRRVGGFNGQYRHSQDMELWVRLASYGFRFHLIPHKLTIRRIHVRQSSTTNMIHCRYDAAAMVSFYLSHFHLFELYRYFDPARPEQLETLLQHLVSRTSHTEATVNHPLLRRTFWAWVVQGLSALPADTARQALERCFKLLIKQRATTAVNDEYLDWCLQTLEAPFSGAPHDPDLTVDGRAILRAPREALPFATALFEYATRLLIDSSTPLFAQELTFHDVNKLVDTPAKLAHSAIRYLAQFNNPYRAVAAANADMAMVPTSADAALSLFCRLTWPGCAEAFERSLAFDPSADSLEAVDAAEASIAALDGTGLDRLRATCALPPTDPLLHYWNALTLAHRGHYQEAVTEASRTRTPGNNRCDSRIATRIANWTVQAEAASVHARTPDTAAGQARIAAGSALDEAQIRAFADGTYSLSLSAHTPHGGRFRAQLRRPYMAPIDHLEITDPTGRSVTVGRAELLDVWTRPLKQGLVPNGPGGCEVPAVAFTLMNSSGAGGGPAMVCRYANWLAELGVQVAVYSNDFPPPAPKLKAAYHHIPDDDERYARISEPVVVLYSILEWPALASALTPGDRTVYHLCQGLEDRHYNNGTFEDLLAAKPLFEALNAVPLGRVVVSPSLQRYFAARDPQPPFLVPNGVDLRVFSPAAIRRGPRITVMAVGSPEQPMKGIQDIHEALAIVRREHPSWPLALRVVGGTGREPAGARTIDGVGITYERAASSEQMARLYRSADVVVNASWYEGYGLPTIEAMACGVPVIQAANQGLE